MSTETGENVSQFIQTEYRMEQYISAQKMRKEKLHPAVWSVHFLAPKWKRMKILDKYFDETHKSMKSRFPNEIALYQTYVELGIPTVGGKLQRSLFAPYKHLVKMYNPYLKLNRSIPSKFSKLDIRYFLQDKNDLYNIENIDKTDKPCSDINPSLIDETGVFQDKENCITGAKIKTPKRKYDKTGIKKVRIAEKSIKLNKNKAFRPIRANDKKTASTTISNKSKNNVKCALKGEKYSKLKDGRKVLFSNTVCEMTYFPDDAKKNIKREKKLRFSENLFYDIIQNSYLLKEDNSTQITSEVKKFTELNEQIQSPVMENCNFKRDNRFFISKSVPKITVDNPEINRDSETSQQKPPINKIVLNINNSIQDHNEFGCLSRCRKFFTSRSNQQEDVNSNQQQKWGINVPWKGRSINILKTSIPKYKNKFCKSGSNNSKKFEPVIKLKSSEKWNELVSKNDNIHPNIDKSDNKIKSADIVKKEEVSLQNLKTRKFKKPKKFKNDEFEISNSKCGLKNISIVIDDVVRSSESCSKSSEASTRYTETRKKRKLDDIKSPKSEKQNPKVNKKLKAIDSKNSNYSVRRFRNIKKGNITSDKSPMIEKYQDVDKEEKYEESLQNKNLKNDVIFIIDSNYNLSEKHPREILPISNQDNQISKQLENPNQSIITECEYGSTVETLTNSQTGLRQQDMFKSNDLKMDIVEQTEDALLSNIIKTDDNIQNADIAILENGLNADPAILENGLEINTYEQETEQDVVLSADIKSNISSFERVKTIPFLSYNQESLLDDNSCDSFHDGDILNKDNSCDDKELSRAELFETKVNSNECNNSLANGGENFSFNEGNLCNDNLDAFDEEIRELHDNNSNKCDTDFPNNENLCDDNLDTVNEKICEILDNEIKSIDDLFRNQGEENLLENPDINTLNNFDSYEENVIIVLDNNKESGINNEYGNENNSNANSSPKDCANSNTSLYTISQNNSNVQNSENTINGNLNPVKSGADNFCKNSDEGNENIVERNLKFSENDYSPNKLNKEKFLSDTVENSTVDYKNTVNENSDLNLENSSKGMEQNRSVKNVAQIEIIFNGGKYDVINDCNDSNDEDEKSKNVVDSNEEINSERNAIVFDNNKELGINGNSNANGSLKDSTNSNTDFYKISQGNSNIQNLENIINCNLVVDNNAVKSGGDNFCKNFDEENENSVERNFEFSENDTSPNKLNKEKFPYKFLSDSDENSTVDYKNAVKQNSDLNFENSSKGMEQNRSVKNVAQIEIIFNGRKYDVINDCNGSNDEDEKSKNVVDSNEEINSERNAIVFDNNKELGINGNSNANSSSKDSTNSNTDFYKISQGNSNIQNLENIINCNLVVDNNAVKSGEDNFCKNFDEENENSVERNFEFSENDTSPNKLNKEKFPYKFLSDSDENSTVDYKNAVKQNSDLNFENSSKGMEQNRSFKNVAQIEIIFNGVKYDIMNDSSDSNDDDEKSKARVDSNNKINSEKNEIFEKMDRKSSTDSEFNTMNDLNNNDRLIKNPHEYLDTENEFLNEKGDLNLKSAFLSSQLKISESCETNMGIMEDVNSNVIEEQNDAETKISSDIRSLESSIEIYHIKSDLIKNTDLNDTDDQIRSNTGEIINSENQFLKENLQIFELAQKTSDLKINTGIQNSLKLVSHNGNVTDSSQKYFSNFICENDLKIVQEKSDGFQQNNYFGIDDKNLKSNLNNSFTQVLQDVVRALDINDEIFEINYCDKFTEYRTDFEKCTKSSISNFDLEGIATEYSSSCLSGDINENTRVSNLSETARNIKIVNNNVIDDLVSIFSKINIDASSPSNISLSQEDKKQNSVEEYYTRDERISQTRNGKIEETKNLSQISHASNNFLTKLSKNSNFNVGFEIQNSEDRNLLSKLSQQSTVGDNNNFWYPNQCSPLNQDELKINLKENIFEAQSIKSNVDKEQLDLFGHYKSAINNGTDSNQFFDSNNLSKNWISQAHSTSTLSQQNAKIEFGFKESQKSASQNCSSFNWLPSDSPFSDDADRSFVITKSTHEIANVNSRVNENSASKEFAANNYDEIKDDTFIDFTQLIELDTSSLFRYIPSDSPLSDENETILIVKDQTCNINNEKLCEKEESFLENCSQSNVKSLITDKFLKSSFESAVPTSKISEVSVLDDDQIAENQIRNADQKFCRKQNFTEDNSTHLNSNSQMKRISKTKVPINSFSNLSYQPNDSDIFSFQRTPFSDENEPVSVSKSQQLCANDKAENVKIFDEVNNLENKSQKNKKEYLKLKTQTDGKNVELVSNQWKMFDENKNNIQTPKNTELSSKQKIEEAKKLLERFKTAFTGLSTSISTPAPQIKYSSSNFASPNNNPIHLNSDKNFSAKMNLDQSYMLTENKNGENNQELATKQKIEYSKSLLERFRTSFTTK